MGSEKPQRKSLLSLTEAEVKTSNVVLRSYLGSGLISNGSSLAIDQERLELVRQLISSVRSRKK